MKIDPIWEDGTVSSKSCDQEQLFTKCQHRKTELTVGVSSRELKPARTGEQEENEIPLNANG